jgi:hypothetical protein
MHVFRLRDMLFYVKSDFLSWDAMLCQLLKTEHRLGLCLPTSLFLCFHLTKPPKIYVCLLAQRILRNLTFQDNEDRFYGFSKKTTKLRECLLLSRENLEAMRTCCLEKCVQRISWSSLFLSLSKPKTWERSCNANFTPQPLQLNSTYKLFVFQPLSNCRRDRHVLCA